MNILFVCSRNQWRSPTAEALFRNHLVIKAKSAGTESAARIKITAKLIIWADVIYVMERKHKLRLQQHISASVAGQKIYILHIPDKYKFMDPELLEDLRAKLHSLLTKGVSGSNKQQINPEEKYND